MEVLIIFLKGDRDQPLVTGLPQLASATSLLDAASKTSLLPTLPPVPTFNPPQNSLKNPGLPMGEILS